MGDALKRNRDATKASTVRHKQGTLPSVPVEVNVDFRNHDADNAENGAGDAPAPAFAPSSQPALADHAVVAAAAQIVFQHAVGGGSMGLTTPSTFAQSFMPNAAPHSSWPGHGGGQKKSPVKWKTLEAPPDGFNAEEESLFHSMSCMSTYRKSNEELDIQKLTADWVHQVRNQQVHPSVRMVNEGTIKKKDDREKNKYMLKHSLPPNYHNQRQAWAPGVQHFHAAAPNPDAPIGPSPSQQPPILSGAPIPPIQHDIPTRQLCQKCFNHHVRARRAGHKCPYEKCSCHQCVLLQKRRDRDNIRKEANKKKKE